MIVRMWEVKAHERTFAELLTWVCDVAVPRVEVEPLHISSEVYSSPEHRIVVITKWRSNPRAFPEAPVRLVARPPYAWDFTPVDR